LCRIDRLQELCCLLPHASNFEVVNTCGQREGPDGVGGRDGHQEMVWSTIKVAMVIMASDGMPTGDAHSHSTGKLFFGAGVVSSTIWTEKVSCDSCQGCSIH